MRDATGHLADPLRDVIGVLAQRVERRGSAVDDVARIAVPGPVHDLRQVVAEVTHRVAHRLHEHQQPDAEHEHEHEHEHACARPAAPAEPALHHGHHGQEHGDAEERDEDDQEDVRDETTARATATVAATSRIVRIEIETSTLRRPVSGRHRVAR